MHSPLAIVIKLTWVDTLVAHALYHLGPGVVALWRRLAPRSDPAHDHLKAQIQTSAVKRTTLVAGRAIAGQLLAFPNLVT